MKAVFLSVVAAGLLASLGCAKNPIVGRGITMREQYFGDVGLTGHDQNITIARGSKVRKLSILGHNNSITVEDEVTIYRVEFWGSGNVLTLPEHLSVRIDNVGTNQIVRRPREPRASLYVPPAEPVTEPVTPVPTDTYTRPTPETTPPQPLDTGQPIEKRQAEPRPDSRGVPSRTLPPQPAPRESEIEPPPAPLDVYPLEPSEPQDA